MNANQLLEVINNGEGITLEFKECKNALNRNVYETVCAFLNRRGGTLLLGVGDDGKITGVDDNYLEQIRKDFITTINNPQKINPTAYLSIDKLRIKGKMILHIYVPESSQVHRCNGRIYDRNGDSDLDITDHTRLVAELYHRKQTTYSENKIYPYATLTDLRKDIITKCRKMATLRREDHPWAKMDNFDILKSAQLYQTDPETGKSGVTLAGILLLGKDNLILTAVPHHRTDLILRKINLDRYDDRDFVDTNLIESYERIMAFVAKHLPDPFYLEGDMSISIRDAIFREVASNILIHREYMNAFPAKFIIERGQVRTENSNKPHSFGLINPHNFSPFPKNPVIARFFREIGRADELGSGMRNLMKYGKSFGGSDPELIDGDIFKTIIKCPDFEKRPSDYFELGGESELESGAESKMTNLILSFLRTGPMGKSEIARKLGIKKPNRYLNELMARLLQQSVVEYTIPEKPNSRLQKYKLIEKSYELLSGAESAVDSGVKFLEELGAESKMTNLILSILKTGPMGKAEIARKLGKNKPNRYLNELMARLLQQSVVEYTIPEKPNSRLQKYRLTEKCHKLLKTLNRM